MPGPRQPGQAEEQLGDEEPGPVVPSDAALHNVCILHIFGLQHFWLGNRIGNLIFVYGKSIDHFFFFGYSTMSGNTNPVE